MTLLDSSILVAIIDDRANSNDFFNQELAVSEITKLAILGDIGLSLHRLHGLEQLFAALTVLPITDQVMARSLEMRQATKLSLHDALVAGTAAAHQITLSTDRPEVFTGTGVVTHNPIDPAQRVMNEILRAEAEC